jgi:deoxyribodipyrimidine photo-lyase
VNVDIKSIQIPVSNHLVTEAIVKANTSIRALDKAILDLYETGYMHNHCRMYIAFLACNLAQSHWLIPAKWMYYYLLDADWASNACSWQWVAGANSSKKYLTNQENINKYTKTNQIATYLDDSYETIANLSIPKELTETTTLNLSTVLPETNIKEWKEQQPAFIYNYYNLDPEWHKQEEGNRVLLLEPEHFLQYPINPKSVAFMIELIKNIPGIQIYTGTFESFIQQYKATSYYYKEHPLNLNYKGICEPRDWICEEVNEYYPSFFAYWKKAERIIKKQFENQKA